MNYARTRTRLEDNEIEIGDVPVNDHVNAINLFDALGIEDIRSFIDIDREQFESLFAQLSDQIREN